MLYLALSLAPSALLVAVRLVACWRREPRKEHRHVCSCGAGIGRLYIADWDRPVYCQNCVPRYIREIVEAMG